MMNSFVKIKNFTSRLTLDKLLIILGSLALIFIIIFFVWWGKGGSSIEVNNDDGQAGTKDNFPRSSISGVACENADLRPFAVMLASDPITRPLSGVSEADIVFEMPVTPGGVTRMMAVYQCEEPSEIGSVRSAREDFIPLASSLGAIYAHWGGEKEALQKLNNHAVDNIDAMKYENQYFYRKGTLPQPHNGFTNFEKLMAGAEDLNYKIDDSFSGYLHAEKPAPKNLANIADAISVNYPNPFNINWLYDSTDNNYRRLRGGQPETDKNSGNQVVSSSVILMKTTSKFISKDYISVVVSGGGEAVIYQNGMKIVGKWGKDANRLDSKLFFYDTEGKEIEFVPGKMWVEIVTRSD